MKYFVLASLILIIGFTGVLNPVRDLFQSIFSPVQYGLKMTARDIKRSGDFFISVDKIRRENLELLGKVESLSSQIVELKSIKEENALLRFQLDLQTSQSFEKDYVLAKVLGNPRDTTGATIVLDRGTKHGVAPGDNVIVGNNLVGVVRQVTNGWSVVALISAPDMSVTVYDIDAPARTEGLAVGQFGTSISMTRILPNENIGVGDFILTSGRDGLFLPDLIVGRVVQVSRDSVAPLKTAFLESMIDLKTLDKVFVIVER